MDPAIPLVFIMSPRDFYAFGSVGSVANIGRFLQFTRPIDRMKVGEGELLAHVNVGKILRGGKEFYTHTNSQGVVRHGF